MDQFTGVPSPREGPLERMAEAIHERWRQEAIAKGETAPAWQDLDESRKNSSRDQASHIPSHLRKVGCDIAQLRGREATEFTFTDAEIELLATAEHARWNRERIADGWKLADKKDVQRKETPYLLPWKQLAKRYPDIAELDAVFIRAMPAILASAGLQIIRKAPGGVLSDAE